MTRFTVPAGRLAVVLGLAVLLSACAGPSSQVNVMGPTGSLQIIAVTHDLERQVDDGELAIVGDPPAGSLSLTRLAGRSSLRLVLGSDPYALIRSVDAIMTASPYLEWSWAASWPGDRDLPLAVAVGLVDQASETGTDDLGEAILGVPTPPSHLLIAGMWRTSPLRRGHLEFAATDGRAAVYSVRGGPDALEWHRDGFDLESLIRRAWPGRNPATLRVAFIAVVAQAGTGDVYLADMVLHR